MTTHFKRLIAAAILFCSTLSPAMAQQAYADAKIDAFARAVIAVSDLGDQWMARVQAAASPEEAKALEQQAIAAVQAGVEATPGITFEEYKTINTAAQTDQSLFDRIQQALNRLQQN